MKNIFSLNIVAAGLMCLFVSVSCCKDREKDPMVIGKTVLVYMASNNNLSVYSAEDYSDLKSGFVPEWFDEGNGDILLVYRHAYGQKPHLIRLSAMDGAVREDTLIYYPAQNSCMDTTFRNEYFFSWYQISKLF